MDSMKQDFDKMMSKMNEMASIILVRDQHQSKPQSALPPQSEGFSFGPK